MLNKRTTVYYAASIAEAQTILKNIAGISLCAGCTEIARRQTGRNLHLPAHVLSLSRVPELCTISKTERYIEFGSSVTLSSMLELGKKNLSEVLFEAIQTIANPSIRTLATLGGNIAAKGHRLTTFAPLLALDARLEVRSPTEALWVPMTRHFSNTGKETPVTGEFISKIRVPNDNWDLQIFKRVGRPGVITDSTSSFAFLVKSQKKLLADIRIAWAGKFFFRQREFENLIIGRSLPLSERDIINLMDKSSLFFDPGLFPPSYERSCFFNLLEDSLRLLT
ncbi:MAG: FAD binding domain-containing protein [Spirochaetales bacterium]|nr:FAD binding domain-containing protein [Spirochaetales bacterium]HNQ97942.1 FAD binding domain-containing protein [Treponemataceae bacterium]